VTVSALPKVHITVDEFLAGSQRQPDERGEIVARRLETIAHNRAEGAAVPAPARPCQAFIDLPGVKSSGKTLPIPVAAGCGVQLDRQAMIVASPLIAAAVRSRPRKGNDVDAKFVDYAGAGRDRYLCHRARQVQDGETALDPPASSVAVAASLGP
jgi:hypothetical protein